MTDDLKLRDIDKTILHHIVEGRNDTQKITSKTTLKTHRIRYSLKKLEKQGLITVKKPDRMVERVVDGQKRVFQAPINAELTEAGRQTLKESNQEDSETYENMTHRELVEKVHQLEQKTKSLEDSLKAFKRQVQDHL